MSPLIDFLNTLLPAHLYGPLYVQGATNTGSECGTGLNLLGQTPATKAFTTFVTNVLLASFTRAQCRNAENAAAYWFNFIDPVGTAVREELHSD